MFTRRGWVNSGEQGWVDSRKRRSPAQRSFGKGLIEEETASLWEPWMRRADQVLDDEQLVNALYEALVERHPNSRTRNRRGTAAEVVLRLMVLKHRLDRGREPSPSRQRVME